MPSGLLGNINNDPFADLIAEHLKMAKQIRRTETKEVPIYQKGTYSPTYLGIVTPGTTTYSEQTGHWTRIGRIVLFNGRVTWTNATGTGAAVISLPFQPGNFGRYAISVVPFNVTFANGSVDARIAALDQRFIMSSPATNAAGTDVAVEVAGDVIFAGWIAM